jgi:hypothetical protein
MKKIIFQRSFVIVTGFLVCLTFNNCKKNENFSNSLINSDLIQTLKNTSIVDEIFNDKDFKEFMESNSSLILNAKDLNKAALIFKSNTWEKLDKNKLAQTLNFKSSQELTKFFGNQFLLKNKLRNKYNFDSLTAIERIELRSKIASYKSENTKKVEVADENDCLSANRNCIDGSRSLYVLELLGCGGITLTAASFSFGLGAGLYAICASAAVVHLDSMMYNCASSYNSCMQVTIGTVN